MNEDRSEMPQFTFVLAARGGGRRNDDGVLDCFSFILHLIAQCTYMSYAQPMCVRGVR